MSMPLKKMGFLPEQPLIAYKFSGRGRTPEHLPTECGNGPNLVIATVTSKVRSVPVSCPVDRVPQHCTSHHSAFLSLEEVM